MLDLAHNFFFHIDLSILHPSTIHFNFGDDSSLTFLNSINMDLIAQQTKEFNQDVLGDMGKGWNAFVKSGQIWALLIGIAVGYMFRSITNS